MKRALGSLIVLLAAWPALAADPPASDCTRQIYHATETGKADGIPAACWHIGPVALGMKRAKVEKILGKPDYYGPDPDSPHADAPGLHYTSALYVFPRDLAARLAAHPAASFAHREFEISFANDRVVKLDTSPGGVGWGPKCPLDRQIVRQGGDAPEFPYGFTTVRLGDPVDSVARRLGKFAPCGVAAIDAENRCSPLPMMFGVGDDGKVGGIAIAATSDDLHRGQMAHIFMTKDPATCLYNGYRLLPKGPGG